VHNPEPQSAFKSSPLVSIGLPAWNCERTLAAAIRSILGQRHENWELLLMEDGSNDGTLEVARQFGDPRISICTDGRHKGLVARLNEAVARSRGKYFARMDADDVTYPERLRKQVEYLEEHPEVDLVGAGMVVFRGDGVAPGCRMGPQTHEEICARACDGFPLAHPTLMGRTSWFRAHAYEEGFPRAEDQVLLLSSYVTSRFACLPEILYGYREEELKLRKILVGRYGFAKGVVRELGGRRKYLAAASAALKQVAKAHVDVFAVMTGLGYRVLGHRARPLRPEDLERWSEVWSGLRAETEGRAGQETILREPALSG
jgi:glycosyltransferase involved in cell wall biosynthesis